MLTAIRPLALCALLALAGCGSRVSVGAEDHTAPQGTLGVIVESREEADKRLMQNGLPGLGNRKCVVVKSVAPNGPNAGRIKADIAITSVNGKPVPDPQAYEIVVAQLKPGTEVEVKGLYVSPGPGGKAKWSADKIILTVGDGLTDMPVDGTDSGTFPEGNGPMRIDSVKPDSVNVHLLKTPSLAVTPTLTTELAKALGVITPDASAAWKDLAGPKWWGASEGDGIALSAPTASKFVFNTLNEDEEVGVWVFSSGTRLRMPGDVAARIYAPFSVSPDEKYIASLDGEYVRVWECGADSLRMHGSTTHDIHKNNNLAKEDIRFITWVDTTHFLVHGWYFTRNRTAQHVQRFTVSSSGVADKTTVAEHNSQNGPWAIEFTESPATAVALVLTRDESWKTPIESLHVRGTQKENTSKSVVLAGVSQPLLPKDDHAFPERQRTREWDSLRMRSDGKKVVVGLADQDKAYVRIFDATTLKPQGGFQLEAGDSISAISQDFKVALVLRTKRTERRKGSDVSRLALLYDLSAGRRIAAFALGDEFYHLTGISLSEDGRFVFAVGAPERSTDARGHAEAVAQEDDTASIAIGSWDAKDGKRRVLTRRYTPEGRRGHGERCGVHMLGGGRFLFTGTKPVGGSWSEEAEMDSHFAEVDGLLKLADHIVEGDRCVESKDLKAAAAEYREVLGAGCEWWFRDQYPKMLNALYDYRAECGERDAAKEIAEYCVSMDMKVEPRTREGKQLAQKMDAEASAREEEAMRQAEVESRKRMQRFEDMRKANRKLRIEAARLTQQEFVDRLDEMKTGGVMGPPTVLQFENFVFPDAIGDPDKQISAGAGKAELGYKCKDGWVWLRATQSPGSQVVVIININRL